MSFSDHIRSSGQQTQPPISCQVVGRRVKREREVLAPHVLLITAGTSHPEHLTGMAFRRTLCMESLTGTLLLLPTLPLTCQDLGFWFSIQPCTSSPPLNRTHMRTRRQVRRISILTAATPMATNITFAPGPDNPAGKRHQDGVTCWSTILCSSAPSTILDDVPQTLLHHWMRDHLSTHQDFALMPSSRT